jgi:hypothetical protein
VLVLMKFSCWPLVTAKYSGELVGTTMSLSFEP